MKSRIEVEEKFFINDKHKLEEIAKEMNFKLVNNFKENDEYFTDINSIYIKNRTCLRLRNTDDKSLELTFKGKSNDFSLNSYAKLERNIDLKPEQYADVVQVLNKLGYYSYVLVKKDRKVYTKSLDGLTYNIMLDNIEDVGTFVEFEILSSDLNYNTEIIRDKLGKFIEDFKEAKLEEAKLPYRDFVANSIFSKLKPEKELTTIFFDLDGTLIDSEKVFFESFKYVLKEYYNADITYEEYKENELNKDSNLLNILKNEGKLNSTDQDDKIMERVYNNYLQKFKEVIKDDEVYLNFELIKQIKKCGKKIGIVSTSKKCFIDLVLEKLKSENLFDIIISREDVDRLKPDSQAYIMAMKKLKVKPEECIAIEDSARGIESSINSGIKTIKLNEYSREKACDIENIMQLEKLSSALLIIINVDENV